MKMVQKAPNFMLRVYKVIKSSASDCISNALIKIFIDFNIKKKHILQLMLPLHQLIFFKEVASELKEKQWQKQLFPMFSMTVGTKLENACKRK